MQDRRYAQAVYAALCNNHWVHKTKPKQHKESQAKRNLKYGRDKSWEFGVSWRRAGDLVAAIRKRGEGYLNFYCSGIQEPNSIAEGTIIPEIEKDLRRLGWECDIDYYERMEEIDSYRDLNETEW